MSKKTVPDIILGSRALFYESPVSISREKTIRLKI